MRQDLAVSIKLILKPFLQIQCSLNLTGCISQIQSSVSSLSLFDWLYVSDSEFCKQSIIV